MANPSLTQYATSGDGFVRNHGSGSWSSLRTGNGTSANIVSDPTQAAYNDGTTADKYIDRGFFAFDLSSIPAGAEIISATLSLYCTGKDSAAGGSIGLVEGMQASTTALATTDFSLHGSTEFVTRVNFASLSTSAYNDFALNASGLAFLKSKFGSTAKLCTRGSFDIDNSAPGTSVWSGMYVSSTEHTGTSQDPKLVVTYANARSAADAWAWSDTADVTGRAGGTLLSAVRAISDTWAWSDTTAKPTTDRTAGTERTVWAGGTIGTSSAHYAFPFVVASGGNGRLLAVCRKATSHLTYDGSLVAKISLDDGNSWGSEYTILDNATTGYDERDPGLVKLASGRLCLVNGKRQNTSGFAISGQPKFYYSDDDGLTWSSGVSIPTGLYGGTANTKYGLIYGSDVVELHNGDLLVVGYGSKDSTNNTQFDIFCAKSTDGGASWTNIGYPVTYGSHSANAVEPQIAILGSGKLILTYHVENGPPQDGYIRTSTDSGVTWSAATLITTTSNRHGLSVMDDGQTVIISYVTSYGAQSFSYIESRNYGASWRTEVQIDSMAADSLYGLWAMSASLSGIGNQQNVGFIYNGENVSQTQASVFYRQFSGMDGVFVYQRAADDSWAWTDTNTRTAPKARTASDAWAWSDAAERAVALPRTTFTDHGLAGSYADVWLWSDAAARASYARTTSDSWAWSDAAAAPSTTPHRTSDDAWTWTDAAAKTQAFSRISFANFFGGISTETWLWSDTATRTFTPVGASRTASDAWAWSDAAGRSVTVFVRALTDTWAWQDTALVSGSGVVVPLILRPEGLPAGTAVGVYRRWEWKGSELVRLGAGPGDAVQATTVGSDLTVALTGLPVGEWVLYAPTVPNRRLFFMVTE